MIMLVKTCHGVNKIFGYIVCCVDGSIVAYTSKGKITQQVVQS
jgi:hypothetical protein